MIDMNESCTIIASIWPNDTTVRCSHGDCFCWFVVTWALCVCVLPWSEALRASLVWWWGRISILTCSQALARSWVASASVQYSMLVPSTDRIWSPACSAPHLHKTTTSLPVPWLASLELYGEFANKSSFCYTQNHKSTCSIMQRTIA